MTDIKKKGKAKTAAPEKTLSFEEGLELLETLVDEMEQGQMALTDLMASYQKGVALAEGLSKRLETARASIQILKEGTLTPVEGASHDS